MPSNPQLKLQNFSEDLEFLLELSPIAEELLGAINSRKAIVGVVGLGYVGLPLSMSVAKAGFHVIGFDTDQDKVDLVNGGVSYIDAVDAGELSKFRAVSKIQATTDMLRYAECDIICICVPTPLTKQREPDLSFVSRTVQNIASVQRSGQLIVLESTTYPGTTDEIVKVLLQATGLKSGVDFFVGYSPEREDPGNRSFNTRSIPKVVAGDGPQALKLVVAFYSSVVEKVIPVSSINTAEVVKITENVFRSVNIGLVNELKLVYEKMGIDIWEVINAASSKPFGFMPFYPGPGLGGHCIPVDPFYLTWKSREHEMPTRFIELAGEINQSMPRHVVTRLEEALDRQLGLSLTRSSVLIVGLAYKKNVADTRESPALKIMEILQGRVADLAFHDPHVTRIALTRNHPQFEGMKSIDLSPQSIAAYDAAIVVTDHDAIDFQLLVNHGRIVVDTRNAFASRSIRSSKIVKA